MCTSMIPPLNELQTEATRGLQNWMDVEKWFDLTNAAPKERYHADSPKQQGTDI